MDGKSARWYEGSVEVKVHSISASNSVDKKEPAGRIGFGAIGRVGKNKQQSTVVIECIKRVFHSLNRDLDFTRHRLVTHAGVLPDVFKRDSA